MLSPKVQDAINRLAALSPVAKRLIESAAKNVSTSVVEEPDEDADVDSLMEDNIKLKNLVLALTNTVSNLENVIVTLTDELEKLQPDADTSLPSVVRESIDSLVERSNVSFLYQIYGNESVLRVMEPPVRAYVCAALIEKFTNIGSSDKIPKLWQNIVASEGNI